VLFLDVLSSYVVHHTKCLLPAYFQFNSVAHICKRRFGPPVVLFSQALSDLLGRQACSMDVRHHPSICPIRLASSVSSRLSAYIAILRRNSLLSKLKAEADIVLSGSASKKSTVDTHRGGDPVFLIMTNVTLLTNYSSETYQFCYFLRKTDPHSVIVKVRH